GTTSDFYHSEPQPEVVNLYHLDHNIFRKNNKNGKRVHVALPVNKNGKRVHVAFSVVPRR
ncbi:unnamed protein product, partial [Amoebophrya sp. A25]